jgi:hypothetical protein
MMLKLSLHPFLPRIVRWCVRVPDIRLHTHFQAPQGGTGAHGHGNEKFPLGANRGEPRSTGVGPVALIITFGENDAHF